tara:strand:- start:6 stop:791 length:786 start_codon:yes stop_codon:yes gene_type:complete
MNKSNNNFDSAKSVGVISNTLNKIDTADKTVSTGINTIMCEIVNTYIHDEFQPIGLTVFNADDVGKHSKKFCVEKLGITETDYKKNEVFSRAKKDSLREAFKIAELVYQQKLYNNNNGEFILAVNKVGKATINGQTLNKSLNVETFNKGGDEYLSLTKKDLLSASSKKYGISNPKTISDYDKTFTAYDNELENCYTETELKLPKNVSFQTIKKHVEKINTKYKDIKRLYVLSLTPQQALKQKLIKTLDEYPKIDVRISNVA